MQEKNTYPRPSLFWRVVIIPDGTRHAIPGKTHVSFPGGVSIFQPVNLAPRIRCKLIFEIPSYDYKNRSFEEIEASVVNVSLVGHRSEFRTSFKFCRDNADLLNLLNRRN
jgi:hypothetical protein